MKNLLVIFALLAVTVLQAQELSYKLEELTAIDFVTAVEKSSKTAILPIGVFENMVHTCHLEPTFILLEKWH